jgi:glyoxylase-like metal-dependent hydrolase (beta-lactamase superfamily II)
MPEALRSVLAPNPSPMTLDGTRAFVVGFERAVVIDPGPDDPVHLRALLDLLGGRRPRAILLTHHHPDHAAGAPRLAAETDAPVCISPGAVDIGFPAVRPDRWLQPDERIDTDAGSLRAVPTPGHSPEHTSFLWTGPAAPGGRALFVGDLMMGVGDTTLVASPEGDLRAYFRSLDLVRELEPSVLLPTHGPALVDPGGALARYRRHRHERIEQVRAAVQDHGFADASALVRMVYGDALDPRLVSAAEGSVRAILAYLASENRTGTGSAPSAAGADDFDHVPGNHE